MADSVEVSTIETTDGTIGIIRDNAARQSIANLREGKETVGSVAWENVKGRPTKVSSFENDKKYQTDENVSNTLNSTLYAGSSTHGGPATSADKLTTARTISLGGAASGSGSFDGSANSTINVSSLDATKLTGVVPITNLPPSVIERMSIVKDDTERFALTTDSVQDGDVVKVQSSNLMYYVVDDSKLSSEAGYEVFKAGSAASVPWGGVTDKPSTFPPSSHTHTKSQITDFPSSMPNPNNLTMQIEGNDAAVYNGGTAQTFNVTKSALGLDKVNNTADADKSVKYASSTPWIGVTGKPSTFPPSAHTHSMSQITDLGVFGGASATAAGSAGLVPQPAAGDQDKYLSAKGTWESITDKIDPSAITTNAANIKKNADAISAEVTRAKAAEKANADTISKLNSPENPALLGPEDDLNNVLTGGFYHINNGYNPANMPSGNDNAVLLVMQGRSHADIVQILISGNSNNILYRTGNTLTKFWKDWRKIADNSVATESTDGLMSAADKSKLDGIDPSAITTNAANIKKNADAISVRASLIPTGTAMYAGDDLNNISYTAVGTYYCSAIVEAQRISNLPEATAFMMTVYNPLGTLTGPLSSPWQYRVQEFWPYYGTQKYIRMVSTDGESNVTWGDWVRMANWNDLGAVDVNASNNSIVRRADHGYIYGTYFNQSSGDETGQLNSSSYTIFANSDGFLRKASVSALSSLVGGSKSAKYTLTASNWSGSSAPYTYDLGPTYGSNAIIGFDSETGTEEQLEAASAANIQGSSSTKIYAYGEKPTVDIPIVIIYQ